MHTTKFKDVVCTVAIELSLMNRQWS